MKVSINGKQETLPDALSVSDLLASRKIRAEVVTVELNDAVLHRDQFHATHLKEGDRLEFLYYMGGGEWRDE